ncbi:hypothetical protein [Pontimicrobium sp. MEBiC06410]
MRKYYIILIIIFTAFNCSCPRLIKESNTKCEQLSIIKEQLHLEKKKFKLIKQDDNIINAIYLSIKDTVSIPLINRRLDSFFVKSYTKKELLTILKVDKAFKGQKIVLELDRKIKIEKEANFETAEEAAKFHKDFMDSLKQNVKFNNKKIKNSIKREKDSLN